MPVTWSSPPGGQDFPLRGSSDGSKASLVTHSPSFLMCVLAACHCYHMLRLLASNADAMEPADVGIDGSSGDESTSCVAIDGSGDDEAVDSGSDGSGDERSRASTTSDESSEGSVSSRRSGGGGLILGPAIKHITYIHIHEREDFSIRVFCFPAGARLPLHDHPRMVVLTKVLLYGSISLKSYDWVATPISNPKRSKQPSDS
ncbi:hypothetical protein GW17_00007143 [Ensete ventricosum]|nr:hypothetical protein GW17_00007143 [Ensete ventricosum]